MKDIKSAITGPCYVGADAKQLKETSKLKMAPIVAAFGKCEYISGDALTYLDFYMLELCDFVQFLTEGEFYEENKAIARYVKRMKSLRQLKRYFASDRYLEKPFNNKVAKINNL
jgi:glutathione S-transferase